ncbi:UNVERIFIED_CONTAM: hypothetical protein NCL1_44234 [Trichonephila clavipes]
MKTRLERCPQQTSRLGHHIVRIAHVQPIASSAAIQAHVAPSSGTPVSSRSIGMRLAEEHFGSRRSLRTATEWNQFVSTDESRFNLSSDDNRVRVWRPRVERLNPAFVLQRNTTPTAGVMVWGAIGCNIRSPLVLIRGTMTAQKNTEAFKIVVASFFGLADIFPKEILWDLIQALSTRCFNF